MAVRGPIFASFDLGNLAEEVHLAYIWAAFKANNGQGHQYWPRPIDPYMHLPEAFAAEPSGRWAAIVQAYRAAKENGDPSTDGLSRYVPPQSTGSRRPFDRGEEHSQEWYLERLNEVTQSGIRTAGSNVTVRQKVVSSVRTAGGNIVFINAIVLGDVRAAGGNISGTLFILKGHRARAAGGTLQADVYECTPKRLYQKAVEFGIIDPED